MALSLEIDEVPDLRISQRARDSFRFHHGGSDAAAEIQLRSMLEDFLLKSARRIKSSGYVELAREGYGLVLSGDLGVVTGYATAHKERTWEQVKAGVPSRFNKRPRTTRETPPPLGPLVPPKELTSAIDPATVHLTTRALRSYAKLRGLVCADDDRLADLVAGELVWFVTLDALTIVGLSRRRAEDPPLPDEV